MAHHQLGDLDRERERRMEEIPRDDVAERHRPRRARAGQRGDAGEPQRDPPVRAAARPSRIPRLGVAHVAYQLDDSLDHRLEVIEHLAARRARVLVGLLEPLVGDELQQRPPALQFRRAPASGSVARAAWRSLRARLVGRVPGLAEQRRARPRRSPSSAPPCWRRSQLLECVRIGDDDEGRGIEAAGHLEMGLHQLGEPEARASPPTGNSTPSTVPCAAAPRAPRWPAVATTDMPSALAIGTPGAAGADLDALELRRAT